MEEEKNIAEEIANVYEISFIQETEEGNIAKSIIEKHGGVVLEDKPFIKIRFAYPIAKQTQGFLGVMKFTTIQGTLALITNDLRLEKGILRHFVTRFSEKNTKEKEIQEGIQETRAKRGKFVRGERKSDEYNRVLSNEALEKKIEEILQ